MSNHDVEPQVQAPAATRAVGRAAAGDSAVDRFRAYLRAHPNLRTLLTFLAIAVIIILLVAWMSV